MNVWEIAFEWMVIEIKKIEIYSNKLHTNVVGGAFLSWMCGITSWSLNEPRKEVAGSFLQCEYLLAFVFSFSCSPHNECDPPSWKTIHLQNLEWCSKDSIYWFQNDWIPKWLDCKMIGFQNDLIAKWLDSNKIGFQNDWNE